MGYVYLFKNSRGKVIYVGHTSNFENRMSTHFGVAGHLQQECYEETRCVLYAKLRTLNEARIYEIFYIGKFNPKYNTTFNQDGNVSFELPIPEFEIYEPKHVIEEREREKISKLKYQLYSSVSKELNELKLTINMIETFGNFSVEDYASRLSKTGQNQIDMANSGVKNNCGKALEKLDEIFLNVKNVQYQEIQ